MSRSFRAEILENKPITQDIHIIKILPKTSVMNPEPGQFFMLQTDKCYDPLLKRPFCMFDVSSKEISFLVKRRGKGTALLIRKSIGSAIDVIGPLGTPYPLVDRIPLIVVGGMGIASLFSLMKKYSEQAQVIYGARNRKELIFLDEIRSIIKNVCVLTDDGSEGEKGTVVDCMDDFIYPAEKMVVYSCGPDDMLRKVSSICSKKKIMCYVSLEQNMACGFGACLGCVVKTKRGYRRVCKEGPVFLSEEVVWE